MRTFKLMTASFLNLALGLALISNVSACTDDGGADTNAETSGDGDGDGDGDATGDGDGDPTGGECYPQPPECALFLECLGAIAPEQVAAIEGMFGEAGSCWCSGNDQAQDCYRTCVEEVGKAVNTYPTVSACHESKCSLDQLDATQPYGPVMDGSCPDYVTEQNAMAPQMPVMNPLGVPGNFCSPKCSGLANYCPDHTQTSAAGTCYLQLGEDAHCISRCWVDPTVIGGTQCQCGATCQPQGAPDGEGNMRGICTFE